MLHAPNSEGRQDAVRLAPDARVGPGGVPSPARGLGCGRPSRSRPRTGYAVSSAGSTGSPSCAEVDQRTRSATIHISQWISRHLPRTTLMNTYETNAGADADRDVERERHEDQRQQRREALLEIEEVDVLDERAHQVADQDRAPARSPGTGPAATSGDEQDHEQEQDADDDRGQPGSAALGHARRALDVAGVRADARRAAGDRARRCRRAGRAPTPGTLPSSVGEPGLLGDRRWRCPSCRRSRPA